MAGPIAAGLVSGAGGHAGVLRVAGQPPSRPAASDGAGHGQRIDERGGRSMQYATVQGMP